MLFSYRDASHYPVYVSRQHARVKDRNHVHNFTQIIHVNGGSYTHYLGNASTTLYETGVMIIPPGLSHFADARWAENDLFFCGFANLTHFNRTFLDKTGLTPSKWRNFSRQDA